MYIQAGLKLIIFLSQLLKDWDYKFLLPERRLQVLSSFLHSHDPLVRSSTFPGTFKVMQSSPAPALAPTRFSEFLQRLKFQLQSSGSQLHP